MSCGHENVVEIDGCGVESVGEGSIMEMGCTREVKKSVVPAAPGVSRIKPRFERVHL